MTFSNPLISVYKFCFSFCCRWNAAVSRSSSERSRLRKRFGRAALCRWAPKWKNTVDQGWLRTWWVKKINQITLAKSENHSFSHSPDQPNQSNQLINPKQIQQLTKKNHHATNLPINHLRDKPNDNLLMSKPIYYSKKTTNQKYHTGNFYLL